MKKRRSVYTVSFIHFVAVGTQHFSRVIRKPKGNEMPKFNLEDLARRRDRVDWRSAEDTIALVRNILDEALEVAAFAGIEEECYSGRIREALEWIRYYEKEKEEIDGSTV